MSILCDCRWSKQPSKEYYTKEWCIQQRQEIVWVRCFGYWAFSLVFIGVYGWELFYLDASVNILILFSNLFPLEEKYFHFLVLTIEVIIL
jgi:hypothetical protein